MPEPDPRSSEVTILLRRWSAGDDAALELLTPLVYEELRRVARGQMSGERADHTLEATALVHEVFLRIVDSAVPWRDRVHFFAIAARQMRRILVDHARARGAVKRGGGIGRVPLDGVAALGSDPARVLDLDDALTRLEALDERKLRVVELHLFAGLSYEETAEALEISPVTVHRDLVFARAWLQRELEGGAP